MILDSISLSSSKSKCKQLIHCAHGIIYEKGRGRFTPAPPVLGQEVAADHNPADDLGHVQSDFDVGPEAHIKALGAAAPQPLRVANCAPPERMSRR